MKSKLFSFAHISEDIPHLDLDPNPDSRFDRITRIAARIFHAPIAAVSVSEGKRHSIKSSFGFHQVEIPSDDPIFNFTMTQTDLLVVPDVQSDPRFSKSQLVTGEPYIRMYAGMPLSADSINAGILCVMDVQARQLTDEDCNLLRDLATWANTELTRIGRLEYVAHRAATNLQRSEEAFFKIIDTLPVGVFVMRADGKPFYANQTAKQILGKGIVAESGPEQLAETYRAYVAGTSREYPIEKMPVVKALEGISSEVENIDIHKPDGILSMQVWGAPVFQDGKIIYAVAAFQDITERRQVERRLAVNHALTEALYDLKEPENASFDILKAIGESLKWEIGLCWKVDTKERVLKCDAIWQAADAQVSDFQSLSRKLSFEPGIGLPGRVWSHKEPMWILDVGEDRNFVRVSAALKNNLHTGFGFPIRSGYDVIGVIEFLSAHIHRQDRDLLSMLGSQESRFSQLIAFRISGQLPPA